MLRTTGQPARGGTVAFVAAVWRCLGSPGIARLPEALGTSSSNTAQPVQGLMEAFYSHYFKALRKVGHWEKQVIMKSLQQNQPRERFKTAASSSTEAPGTATACTSQSRLSQAMPWLPLLLRWQPGWRCGWSLSRHHLTQGFLRSFMCFLRGAAGLGMLGNPQLKP